MYVVFPISLFLSCCLGCFLDRLLGEPKYAHPLISFGRFADKIEHSLNLPQSSRLSGLLAWFICVIPLTGLFAWMSYELYLISSLWAFLFQALLLYLCIGLRSLYEHCLPIAAALQNRNLPLARSLTARIVSRDTQQASERDLSKAAVESLLENGCDAVTGTLFWFMLLGGPGAVFYRLSNTLDAMWGYRNQRFEKFGFFAAKVDDALNYVPARLTALSYALLGHTRHAIACWRKQAPRWSSPNAGPVMAAGAGALRLSIGGPASYEGVIEPRPVLGRGKQARHTDISRAWLLVRNTVILWLAAFGIFSIVQLITLLAIHFSLRITG